MSKQTTAVLRRIIRKTIREKKQDIKDHQENIAILKSLQEATEEALEIINKETPIDTKELKIETQKAKILRKDILKRESMISILQGQIRKLEKTLTDLN